MKIKSLKIGVHHYAVKTEPRASDDPAEIDFETGEICITSTRPVTVQAEFLLHEALHAMVDDAGIDMGGEEGEELAVSALAPRLAAFMADNEDVIHELLDMLARR